MAEQGQEVKTCTKCGETKLVVEYHFKVKATGRRMSWCKKCHNTICRALERKNPEHTRKRRRLWQTNNRKRYLAVCREWRKRNRDKVATWNRTWRLANPEKAKECQRITDAKRSERKKAYRKARADHFREIKRLWKEQNAEHIQAWYHNYYATHRHEYQARSQLRRARVKQVGGTFSAEEWRQLKTAYGNQCLCCGRKEPDILLGPDHVLPIVLGGSNNIDNIQPLCKRCNFRKNKKHIDFRPQFAKAG